MVSIAKALGPQKVCCFTGVAGHDKYNPGLKGVYRRPLAFAKSPFLQAIFLPSSIGEVMIRERPQIVQLATASDGGSIALILKRWLRLPYIIYAHGNEITRCLNNQTRQWQKPLSALRKADAIIANSNYTASLVEKAGVPSMRIKIIHPGCDIDYFKSVQTTPQIRERLIPTPLAGPIILTVGNLVERKGHDTVLQVLPSLLADFPELIYIIVGDGIYRPALESLVKELEIEKNVIFAGQAPTDFLPNYYEICDVFVMLSKENLESNDVEGFGMVFLEAGGCGKPVIGGKSGGIPDAIEDGVSGFLVDPSDSAAIAERLRLILTNQSFAKEMGQRGRKRVAAHFTWSKVRDNIENTLDQIVSRHKA